MFLTLSRSWTNERRDVVAIETLSTSLAVSSWSTSWGGGGSNKAAGPTSMGRQVDNKALLLDNKAAGPLLLQLVHCYWILKHLVHCYWIINQRVLLLLDNKAAGALLLDTKAAGPLLLDTKAAGMVHFNEETDG